MGYQRESGRLGATARTSRCLGRKRHNPDWCGPVGRAVPGRHGAGETVAGPGRGRAYGTGEGSDEGWERPDASPRPKPGRRPERPQADAQYRREGRPEKAVGLLRMGRAGALRMGTAVSPGPAERPCSRPSTPSVSPETPPELVLSPGERTGSAGAEGWCGVMPGDMMWRDRREPGRAPGPIGALGPGTAGQHAQSRKDHAEQTIKPPGPAHHGPARCNSAHAAQAGLARVSPQAPRPPCQMIAHP